MTSTADRLRLYEHARETWDEPTARILVDLLPSDADQLATKADLGELRAATKADLGELRAATKADLGELRAATKADLAELRAATKADHAELRIEIGQVESRLVQTMSDHTRLVVLAIAATTLSTVLAVVLA